MNFGEKTLFYLTFFLHSSYAEKSIKAFDLHALDTPPAFILSQDQTLNIKWDKSQVWYLRILIAQNYTIYIIYTSFNKLSLK